MSGIEKSGKSVEVDGHRKGGPSPWNRREFLEKVDHGKTHGALKKEDSGFMFPGNNDDLIGRQKGKDTRSGVLVVMTAKISAQIYEKLCKHKIFYEGVPIR